MSTSTNFKMSFDFVIGAEGGYSNDPNDAGGETNFGISKRAYPDEDIKNLTKNRAEVIYYKDYWNACSCDSFNYSKGLVLFDCAVNQGKSRATKWAQEVAEVTVDGKLGPISKSAIVQCPTVEFCDRYIEMRLKHYRRLKSYKFYGKGWENRMKHVMQEALG
ncbi:MAG: glycosyl hydrolase 108 family protein [Ghiorsea sp.]